MRGKLVRQSLSNPVSLYNRLGGEAVINAVIRGTHVRIYSDSNLAKFYRSASKEEKDSYKQVMKQYLMYKTGGSKSFQGKSLCKTHQEMG